MNSLNGCWRVMPALGVLIVMGNTYATAEAGCTDSKTVRAPTDVTTDMCPVAVAGFDYTATVGDEVMLDARGSYDVDGDGLQYAWSLVGIPEDSLAEITRINGFDGVFTIDVPGLYIAEVTVTDARGNQSSDRIKIDTSNSAPVAHAGQDLAVVAGEYVELDGTGSGDFDNDPIGYAWKLSRPADSSAALAGANTATPGFAVDVAGDYTAHLVVRDDRGHTAHDDVRISTVNTAPVAHPGWGGRVRLGSTMTLDARASSDVDGDALAYRWSVLTAPADSARQLRNAATPEASLALDAAGHYLLQLLVDDGQLLSEPVILAVEAAENAPPPLSDSQRDVLQRAGGGGPDSDGDGVPNAADNCVNVANPNQRDTDGDGIGNFCDPDFNNDGTVNFADLSIMKANFFSAGDIDTDLNGDGFTNFIDLTILKNFFFGPPGPPGTLTWINGAGGNWNVATNWSPTALPAEGVTAIINLDPDVTVTIGPGVVAEVGDLLLDDNLVLDGGTLDGATVIGAGNVNVTNDSVIDGITMEATMSIENGDIVTVRNNLVVNGSITINGFSLGTGLEFDGSQTLAGSGGIVFNTNFNGTLSEPRVRPIAGATLTIGDGLTISGNNGTVGNPDGGLV
ncbi:MAG: thrombospondin type 3 repeat-containing protein, partial [Gammaproteobacteria bacterium]|nr:thrombospondin type 3 repeat-containing protein [Gammaproteobacteria bacterium]